MILATPSFSGIAPRFSPHALQPNQAQTALNCRLWAGALEPLPGGLSVATIVGRAGVKKALYRMGHDAASDTQHWLSWLTEVDVVRSPIAGETGERTYYTGDGVPKFTDTVLATTATPYPFTSYDLAVPAPVTAATALVSGTADAGAIIETRAYVYTNVRNYGGFAEESAPSAVVLADMKPGQTVTLSAYDAAPTGAYNITHRRFYRTATGSQGTNYYYVGEQVTASTTFADSVSGANLGEVLPSLTWDAPPATLTGLVLMAGGILAGFVGKDVYFCDPYHPHAYPQDYIQTVDYDVVGLCAMGQSLIVLTKGHPYIITGTHPDSMSMQKLDIEQACVSKRSISRFAQGCIYASPDGLVYVGNDGSDIITKNYVTAKEWKALCTLSTLHGYSHDGRYYGFHSTGGFIFDPADRGGALSLHTILADAAYVDLQVDSLFYVKTDTVYKLHAGTDLAYTWHSKRHQLPKPYNFGCAQVLATDYTSVVFKLYVDGVATPKLTKTVTSGEPFRLPAGYLARAVEFELSGSSPVLAVTIAGNPLELQNV
jgi:hypothetical protein